MMRADEDLGRGGRRRRLFGVWTALACGRRAVVPLVDAYGPGNTRASSGGESRVIRMGYGADEIYTRWSLASLSALEGALDDRDPPLFRETGVLWMARAGDRYLEATRSRRSRVTACRTSRSGAAISRGATRRSNSGPIDAWGILEPESGVLMARRAVAGRRRRTQARRASESRGSAPPSRRRRPRPARVRSASDGRRALAGTFVFACGPWLPKVFPGSPRRADLPHAAGGLLLRPAAGRPRFAPPAMPAWIDFGDEIYGIPDLEARGFKLAPDRHGPRFDPGHGRAARHAARLAAARVRGRRFPALADAPLVATRGLPVREHVQRRLPDRPASGLENVWLVGGGSGHGFKHGPAVGAYVAERVTGGGTPAPRFGLAAKQAVKKRAVF